MPLRTRYRPVTDPLQAVTDRYRPLQPVTAAVTDPLQTVTDPLQAVTDRYRPLQPLHTIAANSMSMFMPDETACLHADAGNEPSAGSAASARDSCRAHVRLTSAGCMQSLADMAIAWHVRVRNCPEDETQPLCHVRNWRQGLQLKAPVRQTSLNYIYVLRPRGPGPRRTKRLCVNIAP